MEKNRAENKIEAPNALANLVHLAADDDLYPEDIDALIPWSAPVPTAAELKDANLTHDPAADANLSVYTC